MDEAAAQETAARNRALRLFVAELRKPRYQNPQLYAMLAGTVQTSGPALVPGGASEGHKEIFDIIASSRTGAEAANRLEQMGYESALPAPVQEALVGVLASATGVQQVLNGIRNVEAQYDTQLAPGTVAKIKQNAQRAVQQRRNTSPRR